MILRDDPITAEIRVIRHRISAAYDHDLTRLLSHYQQLEQDWAKHGANNFLANLASLPVSEDRRGPVRPG